MMTASRRRLIAAVCFAPALLAADVPVLQTQSDQWVTISHPGLAASWKIQFPEAVGTSDIFHLVWHPIPAHWRSEPDGAIAYDWQASGEWIREASEKVNLRGFALKPGIALRARMRASSDRIDLSLRLENLGAAPLRQVWSDGGDLQHQSERFIDRDASRTFIRTAGGLVRLSETDRTQRIRALYMFDPLWYQARRVRTWEYFWGRSDTRPVATLVAAEADGGGGAVGIGYEHAIGLMQNSDSHHCMHSAPFFGDLAPGEARVRRGVILFGSSAAELFRRFAKLGYRPDLTPPGPAASPGRSAERN